MAELVCEGLFSHPNEIWDLSSCPFDRRIFSTVFSSSGCLQSSQSCIKHLLCWGWDAREGLVGSSSLSTMMHGYLPWPSILVLDLVLIKRTGVLSSLYYPVVHLEL
ncbi:WD repeat-containing protein DWA2 [Camellia lanceoleosa]|uniref:WD repeat-containing protein DWA2 n=1 Tax=Camellia lanceoleosa TaxID=1840588 RepID=A0ACC0IXB5_9ERIC|nr:WD repeat-containing protein DWA2 [Camellia lanceoleosa]